MSPLHRKLKRKLKSISRWAKSMHGPADWPAALLLAVWRTRPPLGNTAWAEWCRALFPLVHVHPRALRGYRIAIDPKITSSFISYEELFIEGTYDLSMIEFCPDLVIDCGAFEGHFSLKTRAHFKEAHCIAFEPHPRNYAGLVRNLSLNDLYLDARQEAVSVFSGEMAFAGDGLGGRLSLAHDTDEVRQVRVCDICELIARMKPKQPLVKLDIEGEELRVLPALIAVLPATCAIFFEWHHGEQLFSNQQRLLSDSGFVLTCCRKRRDEFGEFADYFAQRLASRGVGEGILNSSDT